MLYVESAHAFILHVLRLFIDQSAYTHTTLFAIKGSNNEKNKQNKEKEAKYRK